MADASSPATKTTKTAARGLQLRADSGYDDAETETPVTIATHYDGLPSHAADDNDALEEELDEPSDALEARPKIVINDSMLPLKKNTIGLGADALNELWQAYKQPKNHQAQQQAREKLIMNYLHLVRFVVNRLPVSLPSSISVEDLISYGTMGLIEAVERFDPERKLKFETYALTRVRGAVIDQLRHQDWVPRGVRRRTKLLMETMQQLEAKLGRPATDEEIAETMEVDIEKVRRMMSESNNLIVSLDDRVGHDSSGNSATVMDLIPDEKTAHPDDQLEATDLRNRLTMAINALPEREKLVIALYYHENMTFREIAEIVSLSESRVCQIHAQALVRLKVKIRVLQAH